MSSVLVAEASVPDAARVRSRSPCCRYDSTKPRVATLPVVGQWLRPASFDACVRAARRRRGMLVCRSVEHRGARRPVQIVLAAEIGQMLGLARIWVHMLINDVDVPAGRGLAAGRKGVAVRRGEGLPCACGPTGVPAGQRANSPVGSWVSIGRSLRVEVIHLYMQMAPPFAIGSVHGCNPFRTAGHHLSRPHKRESALSGWGCSGHGGRASPKCAIA
jgi:hypothetical protein